MSLLLSLRALKSAQTVVDMNEDAALITGTRVVLHRTESGYYALKLCKEESSTCFVTYSLDDEEEWK